MEKFREETERPVVLSEQESRDFVIRSVDGQAALIARYSLLPTPVPDFRRGTDEEVAEFLSLVEVDDKGFGQMVGRGIAEREPSDQAVFEAASLTLAKARLAVEEARGKNKSLLEKFGDTILNKASEALVKVGGKKALIATSGIALMATACSARVAPTVTPETVTPQAVATEMAPTLTPTETATPTVEPSPTPEVVTGDPREVSSWPERYQNYFAHPDSATWEENGVEVTDTQFDEYLNTIRRNYLTEKGIEGAAEMSPQELLWAMIEESAKEQREIILSPTEIVRLREENASNVPYTELLNAETEDYARYGLWQHLLEGASENARTYLINTHSEFRYQASVFGRETTIEGAPSGRTDGDLVGIVDLPGTEDRGILVRIKDTEVQSHLAIFQVSNNPTEFNPSMKLCFGASEGIHMMYCPNYTIPRLTLVEGWTRQTTIKNYPIENLAQNWLHWPPLYVRLSVRFYSGTDVELGHAAGFESWINPTTGLEMVDRIAVSPYDEYHNAPDIAPPFSPVPVR